MPKSASLCRPPVELARLCEKQIQPREPQKVWPSVLWDMPTCLPTYIQERVEKSQRISGVAYLRLRGGGGNTAGPRRLLGPASVPGSGAEAGSQTRHRATH